MIGTIGSLVQETNHRWPWIAACSLYVVSCSLSAVVLGCVLGLCGHMVSSSWQMLGPRKIWWGLLGVASVAYGLSDLDFFRLPRPHISAAVPVSWWRRWKPYGASILYGLALGLGITTQVRFAGFYILCMAALGTGDWRVGGLLLGTYGLTRAVALIPTSWLIRGCKSTIDDLAAGALEQYRFLSFEAFILGLIGAELATSLVLEPLHIL